MDRLVAVLCPVWLVAGAATVTLAQEIAWQRIQLDSVFRSEGVAVADVNHDGHNDVLAGDVWYAAPPEGDFSRTPWKMHALRPVGEFVAGAGYSNSFCNFAYDVNRDGWDDLILIGFPGKEFYWYENPQNEPGHWKRHLIWHSACNESPDFADITGDGVPEIVVGSQPEKQLGFLPVPPAERSAEKWDFHPISRPGDPRSNGSHRYYHGLGNGDFNGDGRTDVLIAHGWYEAPEDPQSGPWPFHPYSLSKTPGESPPAAADMYVEDLDGDGDKDIIMSSAHRYGVWWFENVGGNADPKFRYHLIDESYSQTHALEFVDINGDGTKDLVTGKRFYAHNGRDPGGKEPVVMYWYELRRQRGSAPRFIAHEIDAGRDTGVGTQFVARDFNGDGHCDLALSNKKGVNVLLQVREDN